MIDDAKVEEGMVDDDDNIIKHREAGDKLRPTYRGGMDNNYETNKDIMVLAVEVAVALIMGGDHGSIDPR